MTGTDWLDQLEQKAAAATAGEWVQNGRNGIHTPVGSCIATTHRHEDDQRKADAEFIAAANPHTVRRLIEENRRLAQVAQSDRETAQDFADEIVAAHAERDALAARLARVEADSDLRGARLAAVEALAARWQNDPHLDGHPTARQVIDGLTAQIRAALNGGDQ